MVRIAPHQENTSRVLYPCAPFGNYAQVAFFQTDSEEAAIPNTSCMIYMPPLQTSIIPTPSTPPVPLSIAAEEDCTAVVETPSHSEVVSPIISGGPIPHNHGAGL